MFIHTLDEKTHMKILELADAADLFELTNNSRKHLKEWLPWVDFTLTVEDSKDFNIK
jgi:ribosomal-protein-serine acetyltransferase